MTNDVRAMQLRSWADGAVRDEILDFVARVTNRGGQDYVAPAARIAVFDNDGTLWCEQPLPVQAFFLVDRVKAMAAKDPSLRVRQPYKALLEQDMKTLKSLGMKSIVEMVMATHAGMTQEAFAKIAEDWLATAKHPRLGALCTDVTFRPQIELLAFLREHGFKTYVVTGGGIEFVRAFAEHVYGIPPEQVIGSSDKLKFEATAAGVSVMKLAELNSFDDHEAKPANIALHIGRRPILAFGNSDGDLPMLRYTLSGPGLRLGLLLHHDDADREFAYDRDFKVSPLSVALDEADEYGITLVSMKRDWRDVFDELKVPARRAPALART